MMRIALFACLLLGPIAMPGATAQEAPATPAPEAAPAPAPQPDYYFAFAWPDTQAEADDALAQYESSPASVLILLPPPGVSIVARASKPVHVAGQVEPLQMQGKDSLLLIAPSTSGAFEGEAHLARRKARSSRWSIGFARAYTLMQSPRLDLALLHDDPLDYLVVGQSTLLAESAEAASPLGPTIILGPEKDAPKALAIFGVFESGVVRYTAQEKPAE